MVINDLFFHNWKLNAAFTHSADDSSNTGQQTEQINLTRE